MTRHAPPDHLETARLVLRRPQLDDAEAMFLAWASHREVTEFLTWATHTDVRDSTTHIRHCQQAWDDGTGYAHFLVARDTGRLIGSLASRPGAHGVEFGYVLAPAAWGRGLMVEALDVLATWWLGAGGVHRTWATCHVDNRRSARVLEKAGFRHEGILRKWLLKPARSMVPEDHHCYSRVRGD